MKILFLCTAHNSLSQRLYLALCKSHDVTIEFALSDELVISAVALFQPDLVICPFLTTFVPKHIYEKYLTLIIHPGPPGDVGPSALDWVLMGDDGSINDSNEVLRVLDVEEIRPGRSHWGVTVLQAIEEFDAGPVWAFEQFPLNIDQPGLTKSELYRGPITQAAVVATLAAIGRIQTAVRSAVLGRGSRPSAFAVPSVATALKALAITKGAPTLHPDTALTVASPHPGSRTLPIGPLLSADSRFARLSVTTGTAFGGGLLHHRPLLKAAQRDFDLTRHTSAQISRRIRSGDSQPGALSGCFGPEKVYVYGGKIEDNIDSHEAVEVGNVKAKLLGVRDDAVCIATCDGKGVWISHIRRMKTKADKALWPKVPATFGLQELGLITAEDIRKYDWPLPKDRSLPPSSTFQEVWVEFQTDEGARTTAYVYFDFYNGAMATDQCSRLIEALEYVLNQSTAERPIQAVVLMGGAYFSNGIALNVIEAAADPAVESWHNINRIDDLVHYLLQEFPAKGIVTIAAIRGNAAAGGVALATACDVVIAGAEVVLNPAYRAVGLFGSEFHTVSYYGRCGETNAKKILRSMTPMSALQAQAIGVVDHVFPGNGAVLDDYIRTHVDLLMRPGCLKRGIWKKNIDVSPAALARARTYELGQMALDFWSARSTRYHSRRFDFVRKIKSAQTPLRFATHRRAIDGHRLDEEETDDFDSVAYFEKLAEEELLARLRKDMITDLNHAFSRRDSISIRRESAAQKLQPTPIIDPETKMDPIFSCYYKADLPTPPESPFRHDENVDRFSVLA